MGSEPGDGLYTDAFTTAGANRTIDGTWIAMGVNIPAKFSLENSELEE